MGQFFVAVQVRRQLLFTTSSVDVAYSLAGKFFGAVGPRFNNNCSLALPIASSLCGPAIMLLMSLTAFPALVQAVAFLGNSTQVGDVPPDADHSDSSGLAQMAQF